MNPPQPSTGFGGTPVGGPGVRASFRAAYVLAAMAVLFWMGAFYGAVLMYDGAQMPEGLLTFVSFLILALCELLAVLLTLLTAAELRRRHASRAALVAVTVAVAGVVATIAYVILLQEFADPPAW